MSYMLNNPKYSSNGMFDFNLSHFTKFTDLHKIRKIDVTDDDE